MIIDNKSYFPFRHEQIPGNDSYFTLDKENYPPDVKYSQKKYEPKVLVWVPVSENGDSQPFFRQVPSGMSKFQEKMATSPWMRKIALLM